MKRHLLVSLAALSIWSASAWSLTTREVELTCPLGGAKFKQVLAMSGTSYGRMLDLKPYGPIAAPWTLPVCPGNGFVMYRRDFKDEELDRLGRYVESPEYQEIKAESPYSRVARLRAHMADDPELVADAMLQATWEAGL